MPRAAHASRCFSGAGADFSGDWSQLCQGYASRRSFLPRPGPPRRASHPSRAVRAPPSPNFSGDVSGGLRRGEGTRTAALLTGSRLGPGVSATWRGPHALGDTRGAGAGARGGEGSQGHSFCLISPQLPGSEKFSLRGKKKFLSAACCLILVNVLSHRGGISSEPRRARESPDPGGGGVWVGAPDY